MKIIDNFNFVNKKKLFLSFTFLILSILIIGGIVIFLFNSKLKKVIETEAEITLQTVSSQNILNLRNNLLSKEQFLTSLAHSIEKTNNYSIDDIMNMLKILDESNGFYSMSITSRDGILYNTHGEVIDVSEYPQHKKALSGINVISEAYLNTSKTESLNAFIVPVYKDDEVVMVLSAAYKSKEFAKLTNIPFFDGKGKSMVIDSNGKLVSMVHDLDEKIINVDDPSDRKMHIPYILEHLTTEEENSLIHYNCNDIEYLSYFEKLDINDWYLVSYVPKKYIYKNLNLINKLIAYKAVIFFGGIVVLLIIFFKEYKNYQNKISQIVFFDELTKEKNYEFLKLNFKYMSSRYKKDKYLMVMDIDKFKNINIMHGTETGDELLKYIPMIFKETMAKDRIFKCEGDTFVCILSGKSQGMVSDKILLLQTRIKKDIEDKTIVPMNLSFGLCSMDEFKDLHSIYTNALLAKNDIKGNVNNKINFFSEENKIKIIENRLLESKFVDSLKNHEFEVWYQPKHSIETNEFYGAEALIRWREKDGQLISPAKFIPVFENSGQILELDKSIIEMIFKDIKEMDSLGFEVKPISINLSRVHVEDLGIVDTIRELLDKYRVNPSHISFEITESALIDNGKLINSIISELHHMGFEVDIDDYGTGNSTLNSLYSSDFDTLKLDKSFIDNIGNAKTDIILKSTITMAKDLNMKIVAEGVETYQQLSFLKENNCSIAQGYYFSKPLEKGIYFDYLKKMGLKNNKNTNEL